MSAHLILTTGVYDLIKDHIRRRKVTKVQEEILVDALKNAQQVLRKDLPESIVTVNRKIKVKELVANEDIEVALVAPAKARIMRKKFSILSDLGLATVGKNVGETVVWPTEKGNKEYQIIEISPLA